jgi:hypothetical protein
VALLGIEHERILMLTYSFHCKFVAIVWGAWVFTGSDTDRLSPP